MSGHATRSSRHRRSRSAIVGVNSSSSLSDGTTGTSAPPTDGSSKADAPAKAKTPAPVNENQAVENVEGENAAEGATASTSRIGPEDPTPDAATALSARSTGSPEPHCAICLGNLENKSFTYNFFHMFCFVCLQEWSKVITDQSDLKCLKLLLMQHF